MRILHMGNQCGIASTLKDAMRKYSFTIIENLVNDPFRQNINGEYAGGKLGFWLRCVAEGVFTDLVHIHSHDKMLKFPTALHQPSIIHYHGSEIRGLWKEKEPRWRNADKILYSTRDLGEGAPEEAEYFPNPVSPAFTPGEKPEAECAVHFSYGADEEAEEIAKRQDLPLIIVKMPIQYRFMPDLLRGYTHLIECKRKNGRVIMGSVKDTGSLVSLEALACGLTVVCRDGLRWGLPPEHRPETAARRLTAIYTELIE